MNISFRNATLEDKDFYFLIRKTTIKPNIEKYASWDEEKEYANITSKINIENDNIILHSGKEIGLFCFTEYDENFYLDTLNIIVEYQNRGLGTWIISCLKEQAKIKNKKIKLDTYQNNSKAIKFYLKNGFEISGYKNLPNKYPKVLMEYGGQEYSLQSKWKKMDLLIGKSFARYIGIIDIIEI